MAAKNFKLFICYLGNGATVCNSAVMERGDYKCIAHISPAGNIELYVKESYIPEDAMDKINATAARHRKETEERLDREFSATYPGTNKPNDYYYSRILDECCNYTPWMESDALFKNLKGKSRPEKCEIIKEYYLKHF